VGVDPPGPTAIEREQGQGHDGAREQDVGDENREVDRAERARAAKRDRTDLGMVEQITHEKRTRQAECRQHAPAVLNDFAGANVREAQNQEHARAGVQHDVELRQHAGASCSGARARADGDGGQDSEDDPDAQHGDRPTDLACFD
jgi:hypothetical protein